MDWQFTAFMIFAGVVLCVAVLQPLVAQYMVPIPPTPAFKTIVFDDIRMDAKDYRDVLHVNTNEGLDVNLVSRNEINLHVRPVTCGMNEAIVGISENGTFVCGNPFGVPP